jgi:hypothetical protein
MSTGSSALDRFLDDVEAEKPMDAAWDVFTRARDANAPVAELERLYDAYLAALDEYVAWRRMRNKRS